MKMQMGSAIGLVIMRKLRRSKEIHDELKVNVAAYCKHWLNMRDRHNINGFNHLFKGGKAAV
jgi:hypothetical protein